MLSARLKKVVSFIANTFTIAAPAVSFVGCTDYGAPAPEGYEEANSCCTGITPYEKCYNSYIQQGDCDVAKDEAKKETENANRCCDGLKHFDNCVNYYYGNGYDCDQARAKAQEEN